MSATLSPDDQMVCMSLACDWIGTRSQCPHEHHGGAMIPVCPKCDEVCSRWSRAPERHFSRCPCCDTPVVIEKRAGRPPRLRKMTAAEYRRRSDRAAPLGGVEGQT